MSNRKRGSIALARSLCYQINGAADDSDDIDGGGYGSVDIAEILSAEVVRLQKALAQPEQPAEPVCPECKAKVLFECVACSSNNYPPKRPWVGLTDEEIAYAYTLEKKFAMQYVDAKLKEKNG